MTDGKPLPGDPIWVIVSKDGRNSQEAAVLVCWHSRSNSATVQLQDVPAGVHQIVPAAAVSRRDPHAVARVPETPTVEIPPETKKAGDPFEQLIAAFPIVAEHLRREIAASKQEGERSAAALREQRGRHKELKKLRTFQLKRLDAALAILRKPKGARAGAGTSAYWTPERRAAQGERIRAANRRKATAVATE